MRSSGASSRRWHRGAEPAVASRARGTALQYLNRFEEAIPEYDRALALKPDYAEAHGNRGNALFQLNRQEEALAI